MKKRLFWIIGLLFVTCLVVDLQGGTSAWAAQSTADMVVGSAEKTKIRKEIVGSSQLAGDQQEYTIGYGDILAVSVYGEGSMDAAGSADLARPEMAGAGSAGTGGGQPRPIAEGIKVRMDGRISLLHIGDIQAAGMTTTQLADYLKKLYSSVFDDPILTVTLVQSNSRRYTVMGQVNNPGIFYLDFPTTLVQAVARSGGFTEWANHDISVIRQGRGKPISFDFDDFLKGRDLEKNVYIQADDVVMVH